MQTDSISTDNEWVLVFDTETTGVGPDYRKIMRYDESNRVTTNLASGIGWAENLALWNQSKTYIAQLSYIMYNLRTNEYKLVNKFITDIPADVISYSLDPVRVANTPSEYNMNPNKYTHPITVNTLQKMIEERDPSKKATIFEAISEFISDVGRSTVVTAHNAKFDRQLVFCELARIQNVDQSSKLFDEFLNAQDKMYCTMCMSKEIAHIDTKIVKGETMRMPYFEKEKVYPNPKLSRRYEFVEIPAIKSPALWEVYDRMFGYPLIEELMHDALNDVVACLRVFYRLWMTGNRVEPVNFMICGRGDPDIYGKDFNTGGQITALIDSITPSGIDPNGNFNPERGLGSCFVEGKPYSRIPETRVLSWQQLERIEKNRQSALELKKRKSSEIGGKKRRKTHNKKRKYKRTIKKRR